MFSFKEPYDIEILKELSKLGAYQQHDITKFVYGIIPDYEKAEKILCSMDQSNLIKYQKYRWVDFGWPTDNVEHPDKVFSVELIKGGIDHLLVIKDDKRKARNISLIVLGTIICFATYIRGCQWHNTTDSNKKVQEKPKAIVIKKSPSIPTTKKLDSIHKQNVAKKDTEK